MKKFKVKVDLETHIYTADAICLEEGLLGVYRLRLNGTPGHDCIARYQKWDFYREILDEEE